MKNTAIIDSTNIYLSELDFPLLTQDEEIKLFEELQNGNEKAKKIITESNLRLVVAIAKKYAKNILELDDLIQEGNIGLLIALKKYDYKMGNRFSTYATIWIESCIKRYIQKNARTIKLSREANNKLIKFKKTKELLEERLNRESTNEELAQELKVSIEEINDYILWSKEALSLNDEENHFDNYLTSKEQKPEEAYLKQNLIDEVEELLKNNLTDKELMVIKLRLNFLDDEKNTTKKVGKIIGLSKSRVEQIENIALDKLKQSDDTKKFAIYMDNPQKAYQSLIDYNEKIKREKLLKKLKHDIKIFQRKHHLEIHELLDMINTNFSDLNLTEEELSFVLNPKEISRVLKPR